jgi:hypothetical protein
VGFALVAIVGVLPAGLNVQKENREQTIINQDSIVWMDALRSQSRDFGELTRYVDRVVVSSQNFDENGPVGNTEVFVAQQGGTIPLDSAFIIGLLNTPRVGEPTHSAPAGAVFSTNYVYACVRAFSGSASEMAPQDNPDAKGLAFSYRMVVETTPANTYDPASVLTSAYDRTLKGNLADVRLLFLWPLKEPFNPSLPLDRPAVGGSRLVFRGQLSGRLERGGAPSIPGVPLYLRWPGDYKK